ncbi:MAG: sugar ABC transporter permease [Bacteroidetes bacterium]|nr:sugar ABC transporter permease [Bacteroidota bacterium]
MHTTAGLQKLRKKEASSAWMFCLPALILLFVFLILPFILALGFSFTDQRLIPNKNLPTSFVGLRNFVRLAADTTFHKALGNNFLFVVIVVPLQTGLALGLAMLINKKIKFVNAFRTMYFSPVVTTMVVVAIVWSFLYHPKAGFINKMLSIISFGNINNIAWLKDTLWALPAIIILSIWQGVGFQMVIYLAGLQDIPLELYESSMMDGAGPWKNFIHITLPQLKNTTIFVAISTTILAFKLFTQVWVLTKGGPQNATITTIVYLYKQGFKQLKVGYASAIAIVFFVIVLAVSLIQRYFLREERSIE